MRWISKQTHDLIRKNLMIAYSAHWQLRFLIYKKKNILNGQNDAYLVKKKIPFLFGILD